jgi:hypothetical protein
MGFDEHGSNPPAGLHFLHLLITNQTTVRDEMTQALARPAAIELRSEF